MQSKQLRKALEKMVGSGYGLKTVCEVVARNNAESVKFAIVKRKITSACFFFSNFKLKVQIISSEALYLKKRLAIR